MENPIQQLPYLRSTLSLLSTKDKLVLLFGSGMRLASNLLDLIALGGVAVIALGISQISRGQTMPINIPIVGLLYFTEKSALLLSVGVGGLFLIKSLVAILINFRISDFLASLEVKFTRKLAQLYFTSARNRRVARLDEVQNVIINSANALFSISLISFINFISEVSLLVILIIAFGLVNPVATALLFIYLAVVVFVLNQFVSKRISANARVNFESSGELLQTLRDLYQVRKEVALGLKLDHWLNRLEKVKRKFSTTSVYIVQLAGLPRYVIELALIFGVFSALALVVAISDLNSQAVTIGIFLTGGLRLVASILPLQSAFNNFNQAKQSGYAALELLTSCNVSELHSGSEKSPPVISESGPIIDELLDLNLSHVSLKGGAGETIIDDLTLGISSGQKYAIVGPSGAGKTTLIELMMGLQFPSHGEISVNGQLIEDFVSLNPNSVAYVPQKPSLIHGTLRDNLTLDPDILTGSDEKLLNVLAKVGLDSLIMKLGDGLDAILSPDNSGLSGGEVQRIGIARALIQDPKVLFLDEATSALDANSELKIANLIDELSKTKIIVVIAHRLSTVMNANVVFFIQNGKLIDQGTFGELSLRVDKFREMLESLKIRIQDA